MADYDPTTENEAPWEDHGIDHDDDDDEKEEVDTTRPFQPGAASTPASDPYHGGEAHEMSNLDPEHDEGPFDDLMPLLEEFVSQDRQFVSKDRQSAVDRTINFIKDNFKTVDLRRLEPIGWGKKPENRGEIVHFETKGGEDRILKKDGSGLQTSLKMLLVQAAKNYLPKRIKKSEKQDKG